MIGSIRGKIIRQITDKNNNILIIEVNNIGYKIHISTDALSKIDTSSNSIFFWIYSHIREDTFDLYGFLEYEELEFFELLVNHVSGIGPKGALTILNIASIETLNQAIQTNDISYLTKISGIGKKTAQKMVLELKDKIKHTKKEGVGESSLQGELDTLEALKSLGYSQIQARDVLKDIPHNISTTAKIREALKLLGKK